MPKINYWWSEDRKWFCILASDGNGTATVSLTPEEAGLLSGAAEPAVTNLDIAWEQINALGGAAIDPISMAVHDTVEKALTIIAGLGGEDPLPKRAAIARATAAAS